MARSDPELQVADNNPYSADQIHVGQYGDETTAHTGIVVRSEQDYPVAIVLIRPDKVTCRFMGFAVSVDPLDQTVELVERVIPPAD